MQNARFVFYYIFTIFELDLFIIVPLSGSCRGLADIKSWHSAICKFFVNGQIGFKPREIGPIPRHGLVRDFAPNTFLQFSSYIFYNYHLLAIDSTHARALANFMPVYFFERFFVSWHDFLF